MIVLAQGVTAVVGGALAGVLAGFAGGCIAYGPRGACELIRSRFSSSDTRPRP